MRWYEWAIVLAVLGVIGAVVFAPSPQPKPVPVGPRYATEAQVLLLQDAQERNDRLIRADVAVLAAKVTLLEARIKRLESVVPVQAIRDRSKVK